MQENFHDVDDIEMKNVADFYLHQKNQAELEPATKKIVSQPLASLSEKEREVSEKLNREMIYCESFMEIFHEAQKHKNFKQFIMKLVDIHKVFFEDENIESHPKIAQILGNSEKIESMPVLVQSPDLIETPLNEMRGTSNRPKSYPPANGNQGYEPSEEMIPIRDKMTPVKPASNNMPKQEAQSITNNLNTMKDLDYEKELKSGRKEPPEISYNFNLPHDLKIQKPSEQDYDDFSHENLRQEYPQLIGRTPPAVKTRNEIKNAELILPTIKEVVSKPDFDALERERQAKIDTLMRENNNLAKDLEILELNKRDLELKLKNKKDRSKYHSRSRLSSKINLKSSAVKAPGNTFYEILRTKDNDLERLQNKIGKLETEIKQFKYPNPFVEKEYAKTSQLSDEIHKFTSPLLTRKSGVFSKSTAKLRHLESDTQDFSTKYDSSGTAFVNQMFNNIRKVLDKPSHKSHREHTLQLYDYN